MRFNGFKNAIKTVWNGYLKRFSFSTDIKKSVQKRTDFFDNSFFNAVPDKPLATRNKPHNNQLCADLSRFISAYSVVSHFLRFAWQTTTFENGAIIADDSFSRSELRSSVIAILRSIGYAPSALLGLHHCNYVLL